MPRSRNAATSSGPTLAMPATATVPARAGPVGEGRHHVFGAAIAFALLVGSRPSPRHPEPHRQPQGQPSLKAGHRHGIQNHTGSPSAGLPARDRLPRRSGSRPERREGSRARGAGALHPSSSSIHGRACRPPADGRTQLAISRRKTRYSSSPSSSSSSRSSSSGSSTTRRGPDGPASSSSCTHSGGVRS